MSLILHILDTLRRRKDSKAPIGSLLEERYEGKIPPHTGGGIFGSELSKLIDTGFIELYNGDGSDITAEIANIGDPTDWTLRRGYEIAHTLSGREDEICVVLTNRLAQVQSLLGVSITQLLEDRNSEWMRIQPLFGKPCGVPREDVFVLMPFHADFLPIYSDHIKKVCDELKLGCKRADDIFGSNKIIDDVWELIANSKVIVADCTGRNPNVFYELGIAHTLGKKVVVTAQSENDIPFDIQHIRYIKYNYTPRGMKEFEIALKGFILQEVN